MVCSPRSCKIDLKLSANEVLNIAPGWNVRRRQVPGLSEGHLAIYDEKNRAAFTSDAVQAGGYQTASGHMAFGPTYYTVNDYLETIAFLEKQSIEHVFSGHWPAAHNADVKKFLSSSRDFVERVDENILQYLRQHARGATLKTLLHEISPKLGKWSQDADIFLQFAMYGHLERLTQNGILRADKSAPVNYRLI